jgi:hypothetical protein
MPIDLTLVMKLLAVSETSAGNDLICYQRNSDELNIIQRSREVYFTMGEVQTVKQCHEIHPCGS